MRHKRSVAIAAVPVSLLLVASAQLPVAGAQDAGIASAPRIDEQVKEDDAPTRFIVDYAEEPSTPEERAGILNSATDDPLPQVTEVREREDGTSVVTSEKRMSEQEIQEFIKDAQSSEEIAHIEEDVRVFPMAVNDPHFRQQWALNGSAGPSIETAWSSASKKGAGQTIAVLDTGITPHPDLDQNVKGGYDFISAAKEARDGDGWDPNPRDEGDWGEAGMCGGGGQSSASSWHGTHVAGTSAAVSNNGQGVASVAPRATLQPVRVMGPCGGYSSDIIDAMDWASGGTVKGANKNPNPATIINMSLGGQGKCSRYYQEAVDRARSRGTVVVVAAGNESQNAANVQPASCRGVVTVAASGPRDQKSSYSNYGTPVDITAPGGDDRQGGGILSTYNSGQKRPAQANYSSLQGTSMATPFVSGVVALIRAENPGMSPDQVAARLRDTARPLKGSCNGCGAGIVDPAAAVGKGGGGKPEPTKPAPEPPIEERPDPSPPETTAPEPPEDRNPGRNPGGGWDDWDFWDWDPWAGWDDWGFGGWGKWPWSRR